MRRRTLGSEGPAISTIGLGSWAIGGAWKWGWGEVDDRDSVAAIRRALELGVNWVDTAPTYGLGHSEEVVARALEPFAVGEEVYVFTKCGLRFEENREPEEFFVDLRPEFIREECEGSLRRLGLERIDLYQLHWPDNSTGTPVEDSWGALVELANEGKARWIGVSNFDVELLERCEAIAHVDSLQPPFNLLDRSAREDVIPWCREHGTGVIVYSPLGSGLLTGAYDRDRLDALPPGDWRRSEPAFQEPGVSATLTLVERLRPLAARLGVDLAALALAWTLAVPGVTGAIAGARLPEHVESWSAASDLDLPPDVLEEIEAALAETGAAASFG